MSTGKRTENLYLNVFLRLTDPNALILRKTLQEVNTLMEDSIPQVTIFVLQILISVRSPVSEELRFWVSLTKSAAKACSKQRPKTIPARVSRSCQPSR
jgi:hypothetical protein